MVNLEDQRPRRLSFATARELLFYFRRNEVRASYCALGLLYPAALGLQAAEVDQRHRAFGNLHDLGAALYKEGVLNHDVDEGQLAPLIPQFIEVLVSQVFPSEQEVKKEMGNS